MAAPFFARVTVGHVHFDHGEGHGLDRVVQRHAELRQPARIEDRAGRVVHVLMERIDQRALVVRLEEDQLDLELLRHLFQLPVDVGERHRAVDVRLAAAKQVQVRAVQHQDLHCFFQFFSRFEISAGLKWQPACSRA
jgi:hypothetical protein